jgi:hypothetical protein
MSGASNGNEADYPTNLFAAIVELWPPKPNELLTMAFTVISRAVLGT